jgi:hypothetical protein
MMGTDVARTETAPAAQLAGEVPVSELSNDAVVIQLHFTINHLSRWLSPIHDQSRLERSPRRGEPSVKELMVRMRDEERRVFPWLHAIATTVNPDLDKLPAPVFGPEEAKRDQALMTLEVMAEFRRLRQSTCSLLRTLPDLAWERIGISRRTRDWSLRALAERLIDHDLETLYEMDLALDRAGAREGIAAVSRVHLPELLRLSPAERKR